MRGIDVESRISFEIRRPLVETGRTTTLRHSLGNVVSARRPCKAAASIWI